MSCSWNALRNLGRFGGDDRLGSLHGQGKVERHATRFVSLRPDPSVVRLDDSLADGQPQTDAAAAFVEPITDNKGTEAYKRSLLKGLVKRAFEIVERRRRGETVVQTHFYYG